MSSSPTLDLPQDGLSGCRSTEDLLAAAARANSIQAALLSQSLPISSKATSECASTANQLQAGFAETPKVGSVAFSAYGRAEAASSESWLMARLDSVEVLLNRRCDALESRVGVLTGAIYGDASGFQRQIEALDFKLEAAQKKWEALLSSFRSDMNSDRATVSALADALIAVDRAREGLQAGLDETRQLLLRDAPAAPGSQGRPAGLAPHLQRLIERVERTCTDLSGKIAEEARAPPRTAEPQQNPSLSQRSVSTSQLLGHTSTHISASTGPSGQHGSFLPAARVHSSMLAASTLTPLAGANTRVAGQRARSPREVMAEAPSAVVRRTSLQPSIGGSSTHSSRLAARPRPDARIAGPPPQQQVAAVAPRIAPAAREHLALV